jgi:hypothetical protein
MYKDKEAINAYHREYYKRNTEKVKKNIMIWRKNNKLKLYEYKKNYYSNPINKLKLKIWRDKYYKKNRKYLIRYKRKLRSNPDYRKREYELINLKRNNSKKLIKLQKHHWNYNKPLLVNTLCSECHHIQHRKGI